MKFKKNIPAKGWSLPAGRRGAFGGKKIGFIVLTLALVLSSSFIAKAEVSQATIDYLLNSAQDQWVTQGLASAGQVDLDLAYLDEFSGQNANEFAKTILAVVAAGENPYDFNSQNLVEGLLGYHNNNQIGATNLLNDDIWGVIALASAGVSVDNQAVLDAKNYLLAAQNEDGGWGFSPEASSDTNDTASAVMALLDAGLSSESSEIISALAYLQDAQNEDGGFGFYEGSESDSGSDAWVIAALNKLDIDPTNWESNGHNPVEHLESLYLENGSYKWVASEQDSSLLMTAYAAVALADSYYPVAYYEAPQEEPGIFYLRIEGPTETICEAQVEAITALDIVANGAEICDYEYNIDQTPNGPYLNMINGIWAEGAAGWLYWVNWESAMVGAADYQLQEGDGVLWSYGEWGIQPMKISLDNNQVEPEDQITATVEYYNGENWLAVNEAWVRIDDNNYQTNQEGQATFSIDEVGAYEIYAEKDNFIRTNRENLMVGNGLSRSVDLSVIVNNPGGGGGGNTLLFILDTSDLDFGTLEPGDSAARQVQITNNGEVAVYLEGVVSGVQLFEDNIEINEESWENYATTIPTGSTGDLDIRLEVPGGYGGDGQKTGDLVFWGSGQ